MPDAASAPLVPAATQVPPLDPFLLPVPPDPTEIEAADTLDEVIPSASYHSLPIVGLGGSAGSLAPLQEFFRRVPPEPGLAFVVVLHLSPDHESSLAEILQRCTSMPVLQVSGRTKLALNRVYVIPPAKQLLMDDGHVILEEFERDRGKRTTIDLFFRTLAETHGASAVAIVLSGADADGSIGIKRIKERGGLTIAQAPDECEQASMPRAAIATGMIDWVLSAAEMPSRLMEFRSNGQRLNVAKLVERTLDVSTESTTGESALKDILGALRAHTGRDFTGYKRGTILRRIARRMQVNGASDLPAYHTLVRTSPAERKALLQDLLISVTNFFRDAAVFESLWTSLPELFKDKGPSHTVRVWVPGCATGEEAYSIAMLLCEYAAQLETPPQLQVFATDLDEQAVAVGRLGQYPESISADISEERLRHFFVKTKDHYRVTQRVREMVLFAVQDLLRDAPFSRIDLVSCRNLLIYFTRESQRRVFEIFHFALRPDGQLLLGTSESADDSGPLFEPVHKKYRLYRRRIADRAGRLPNFAGPVSLTLALQALEKKTEKIMLPLPVGRPPPSLAAADGAGAESRAVSPHELHLKLVERFAPPSLVVNHDNQVVHLSGKVGRFLQFPDGELQRDVLQLVHPMLRLELRTALFRAAEVAGEVEIPDVPVDFEGLRRLVDISVRSAPEMAPEYLLVEFQEHESIPSPAPIPPRAVGSDDIVRSLERELTSVKQHLQVSREEHGSTTEEMRAANEELHAMNEELRSASEELETSREELQSINEELVTVNQDLKIKVDELARANSDTVNLMVATNVATVFLDHQLCVVRYTPSAVGLFHLIASDVGRPLADLRHRLEFDTVITDAEDVLKLLKPVERETRAADGRWFLARTTAYRTADDHVEGVVLTFVDISRVKAAEDALRTSEARFRGIVDQTAAGVCLADLAGTVSFANPKLGIMLGRSAEDLVGCRIASFFEPAGPDITGDFARLASHGAGFDFERQLIRVDGQPLWANINVAAIRDRAGQQLSCVAVFVDVSQRKQAEDSLRRSKDELELRVQERTAELKTSNVSLRLEMDHRKTAEAKREEMMRTLVASQEVERGRISRELHDEIGQHVTALLFGLTSLRREVADRPAAITTLQSLQAITESVGRDLHQVALELRPTALDDLGLVRALSAFLEDWARRSQLEVEYDHQELGTDRLPGYLETTLYRVVCEAVHNVIKHAKSTWVSVLLQRKDARIIAVVEDDGVGFDVNAALPALARPPLGIIGMTERVVLVDGELTIESVPGRGTTVIVKLPLPHDENRK